jgi:Methyltransferase domain
MVNLPADLDEAIQHALQLSNGIEGFLGEQESRFLVMLAACTPAEGAIVEIGSFKGKSTVALGSVAARYGLEPVVAIDPHTAPSPTDPDLAPGASSFDEFMAAIRSANLEKHVDVHRSFSREVAKNWGRPIRLLWIDGEHTYKGAKEDFDLSCHIFRRARSWRCMMRFTLSRGQFAFSLKKFCARTGLELRASYNPSPGDSSDSTTEPSFGRGENSLPRRQRGSCPS